MGNCLLPYLPRLHGYAYPRVVNALREVGAPAEIAVLPAAQRGPLLATLAGELCNVVVQLLYSSLHEGALERDFHDLLRKLGGATYRNALAEANRASDAFSAANNHFLKVEREVFMFGVGSVSWVAFENGTSSPSPHAKRIYWDSEFHSSSTLAGIRRRYERATAKFEISQTDDKRARDRLEKIRGAVENSERYRTAKMQLLALSEPKLLERKDVRSATYPLRANFASNHTMLFGGASYILRMTEAQWWTNWTQLIEDKVRQDADACPARIVLRHPRIVEEIAAMDKKTNSWLKTAATVLGDLRTLLPDLHLPLVNISAGRIGGLCHEMRQEDLEALTWIKANGGTYHPSNPYRTWLLEENLSNEFYRRRDFTHMRADHELMWCLSRRDPGNAPFKPIFSILGDTREAWEKRVARWAGATPDYWMHPQSAAFAETA